MDNTIVFEQSIATYWNEVNPEKMIDAIEKQYGKELHALNREAIEHILTARKLMENEPHHVPSEIHLMLHVIKHFGLAVVPEDLPWIKS